MNRGYGSVIRRARKNANLKQLELASLVNCSDTHISAIEHEKRLPGTELLFRICDVLRLCKAEVLYKVRGHK